MQPQALTYRIKTKGCLRCGNLDVSTMEDLRDLVTKPNSQFSSDLADWLVPPQKPKRPVSKRYRTGLRNSISFGVFWLVVMFAICYALSGSIPNLMVTGIALAIAIAVGLSSWRSEYRLATEENNFLLAAHWERYRVYLQRRRVWDRLRYCPKCGIVIDPVTLQSASLYDVHELANSKVKDVILK